MCDENGIDVWIIVQKVGPIITIHDPKLCPLYPKVIELLSLAANKTQRVQWSNLCEKTYGKSLLRFLTEHTLILSAWACVPRAAAPLPNISQSLWIPVRLEQLLSQHYPLSCPSPLQNTRLWWLFSFWILVNIFILHWRVGVLCHDSRWGVINNICPISSHCGRKWEREEEEGESHSWNSPEPMSKQKPKVSMEGTGHI